MRLKKVTLNNYRCFENLEVELHPRLTVLVGENGAGKTAILDGIAVGLSPILRYLSSANQRLSVGNVNIKDTEFRIEEWKDKFGRKRWAASEYSQIIVETQENLKWDCYSLSREGVKPSDVVGETALADVLQKIWDSLKTAKPEPFPVFAYYGVQRGRINELKGVGMPKEAHLHPALALVDALDPSVNFEELLNWFFIEESDELRTYKEIREFLPHQDLNYKSPSLTAVRDAINIMLGSDYVNPHFNRDREFVLESSKTGIPLQISQLSQGYQSVLALAMDFARRLTLANGHWPSNDYEVESSDDIKLEPVRKFKPQGFQFVPNPLEVATLSPAIMLVDEIDLHLHPSWQQRVLDDLMRAFPGTQFIATTHSPQVLTTVPAECIRILHNELNSETGQMESWLETPVQQTRGVSSADVLASAMAVDPVPNVPEAAWLSEYRAFIQQGLQDSAEGLELKDKLIGHFGPRHPEVLDCERMIRWEAFKQKLPSPSSER